MHFAVCSVINNHVTVIHKLIIKLWWINAIIIIIISSEWKVKLYIFVHSENSCHFFLFPESLIILYYLIQLTLGNMFVNHI